jgi:hypothetical protein
MINYSCIEFTGCYSLYMSSTGVNLTQVENESYIAQNFWRLHLTVKISLKKSISPWQSLIICPFVGF